MSPREGGVDQDFHIEQRTGTTPPVVAVSGEIDVATAPQLRECLHNVIAQGDATIVLASSVTAVCARSLPVIDAPVLSEMPV